MDTEAIVVTGGAGFIGSHLCVSLRSSGFRVVAVDDLSLGREDNVAHLDDDPQFELRIADVSDVRSISDIVADVRPRTIFHLAANSDIAVSLEEPANDYRRTFQTTWAVLEAARAHDCRELVFASTSAVYGDAPGIALGEGYGPLQPVSHYGAAKLASEGFISSFAANYGIRAWIARFPNVVGERSTHGVILDFINKLQRDQRILEVLGDGKQSKPYLYVQDLVEALLFFWTTADEPMNLVNLGVDSRTTVKRIASIVCAEMGLDPEIRYTGGDRGWVGDVPEFRYDLTRVHAMGWRARYESDEAVRTAVRRQLAGMTP